MNDRQRLYMLYNIGFILGAIVGMAGGVAIGYQIWG